MVDVPAGTKITEIRLYGENGELVGGVKDLCMTLPHEDGFMVNVTFNIVTQIVEDAHA